jgi:peptidyl-tRNA hydrolase, PTH1 family
MKYVVGLGNPGSNYEFTRHNIGIMIIEEIARKKKGKWKNLNDFYTQLKLKFGNITGLLIKPKTFMNNSGMVLSKLADNVDGTQNILVVVDDYNLDLGMIRFRVEGGNGGHNGLKSIEGILGTNYPRLRVGIGAVPENLSAEEYVLEKFTDQQWSQVVKIIEFTAEAVIYWLENNIGQAMNKFNGINILQEA